MQAGTQVLGASSDTFPDALIGSYIRSGAAGTIACTLMWNADVVNGCFTCYTTMSLNLNFLNISEVKLSLMYSTILFLLVLFIGILHSCINL